MLITEIQQSVTQRAFSASAKVHEGLVAKSYDTVPTNSGLQTAEGNIGRIGWKVRGNLENWMEHVGIRLNEFIG
jgi:hypothetical protein